MHTRLAKHRRVLVDTGPIVAILSEDDEHHAVCVEQLHRVEGPLLTCWPVITEALWLLRLHPRAAARFLTSFNARPFSLVPLQEADLSPIAAILAKYEDLGVQVADASLLHWADREGIETVFTLDRRHFGVMRMARGRKVNVIP